MGKHIVVLHPIVAADFAIINTGIITNQAILDAAAIILTKAEAKSMINVSVSRNSEIVDVKETVVEKHANALPVGMTAADFEADFTYVANLRQTHKGLVDQTAKMEVLLEVGESNLYVKTCDVMKNVRLLGEKDQVLGDIAKANSLKYHVHSTAQSDPTNFKIGPAVVVIQGGVIVGKYFTNKAKAVLSILNVKGDVNDTILVNPFTGVLIPVEWTSIVITNLSTIESGSFDIYLK